MGRIGYITVRIALFCVVVFGAILSLSCSLFDRDFTLPEPSVGNRGMLVLTFNSGLRGGKTLAPDISMEPAFYDIAGNGPLDDHFERTVDLNDPNAGDLQVFDNLTPGAWTITVDARNAAGTVIGHGETNQSVEVGSGDPTPVTIDVLPLSGTGRLDLLVTILPKATYKKVTALCSLTSIRTGESIAPSFTFSPSANNPETATYSHTAIEAGYYLLLLRMYAGEVQFWGIAEAVRIVAGQTTIGTWTTSN